MPNRLVGAVLCGGRSSRFGTDKALAPAGEQLVGERVVSALRTGGVDPVVAIGGDAGNQLRIPTVPDLRPDGGPLGGLATALLWAKTGSVLIVPCDLVLLRSEHVAALVSASRADPEATVVATVGGAPKISLSCWPASHGRTVLKQFDSGVRAFRSALDGIDWVGVEVGADAVADADTPEELARLLEKPSTSRTATDDAARPRSP